jgi:hypothetical protein
MNQKLTPIKIFLLCPVPEEQKPISQFTSLKNYFLEKNLSFQPFNQHTTLNRLILIEFNLIKKIQSIFFFLSWKELEQRLNLPIVSYEEASWYDGQIWEKSFFIIKKDQLLNTQFVTTKKIKLKKEE